MNSQAVVMDKPKAVKKEINTAPYLKTCPGLDGVDVLKTIKRLKIQMDCVYDQLNFVTDETLIDSYIYEMKAIHMRYKYYIDLCKQQGLSAELF